MTNFVIFLAKSGFRLWSSTFWGGTWFYEWWTFSEHSMMWNGWLIFFGFLNFWFIFTRNISEFGNLNMQSLLGFLMCRVFTKNTLIAIHLSTYLSSPFQYLSTPSTPTHHQSPHHHNQSWSFINSQHHSSHFITSQQLFVSSHFPWPPLITSYRKSSSLIITITTTTTATLAPPLPPPH